MIFYCLQRFFAKGVHAWCCDEMRFEPLALVGLAASFKCCESWLPLLYRVAFNWLGEKLLKLCRARSEKLSAMIELKAFAPACRHAAAKPPRLFYERNACFARELTRKRGRCHSCADYQNVLHG